MDRDENTALKSNKEAYGIGDTDLAIIVLSCDKYNDLWAPFFTASIGIGRRALFQFTFLQTKELLKQTRMSQPLCLALIRTGRQA